MEIKDVKNIKNYERHAKNTLELVYKNICTLTEEIEVLEEKRSMLKFEFDEYDKIKDRLKCIEKESEGYGKFLEYLVELSKKERTLTYFQLVVKPKQHSDEYKELISKKVDFERKNNDLVYELKTKKAMLDAENKLKIGLKKLLN